MIDAQYETLMRENMKLEREISELKEMLEQERSEKAQLFDINEDNKVLISKLGKELEVAKKKLTEELVDKRERKLKYDAEAERLRHEIERRQKEIEAIQTQAVEPVDMDIFRIKTRKEFEAAHALEVEEKQNTINKLIDERNELKRELQFVNTKHDNMKFDFQRDIESNKLKYREELQVVLKENEKLQSQIENSKEKELLRQARRDLEESKRRLEEIHKECNDLRKDRDKLKDEKNDLIINFNRDVEDERSKKREAIAQGDKLKFKIRALEDDLQKHLTEIDKKNQQILKLKSEKQAFSAQINEKDLSIEILKRQMNECRDKIKDKESEIQAYLRRKSNEETDFELIEKRRFEKIQSDLDSISKEYRVLEVERNNDREKHLEQFGRLETNYNNR